MCIKTELLYDFHNICVGKIGLFVTIKIRKEYFKFRNNLTVEYFQIIGKNWGQWVNISIALLK